MEKSSTARKSRPARPRRRPAQISRKAPQPRMELFQREDCPFSHRVRMRLSQLGLDFVAHSVPLHDDLKHEKLVQVGGKDQIPFLVDHRTGVKLYDSEKILAYLTKEYGEPPAEKVGMAESRRKRRTPFDYTRRAVIKRLRKVTKPIQDVRETVMGTIRVLTRR